jgi:septum formation protein
MKQSINKSKIILASKSPRRKYLLEQAGINFCVIDSCFDETLVTATDPKSYTKLLAEKKATSIWHNYPDHWVIGADTIVVIDNKILGKPKDKKQAKTMLTSLSDKTHRVITGFAICSSSLNKIISKAVETDVKFKKLTKQEIKWYTNTDEPFDKAGAYAIQGIGTFLVQKINGSYTNVIGLPVCEVIEILLKEGALSFPDI